MTDAPHAADAQQLELLHAAARPQGEGARSESGGSEVDLPVARVVLEVSLPHLDREFEYAVTAELADTARPGARVRVRFAGKEVGGFIVSRVQHAEHLGKLAPLKRVVSAEAVLTPEVLDAARSVAGHYAGPLADVLRLAVPPRHAGAEKALDAKDVLLFQPPEATESTAWQRYPAGPALLGRLAAGQAVAAAWTAAPTTDPAQDWPAALAQAARSTLSGGRGALIVVPDHRDVDRVAAALSAELGDESYVRLTAEQGPQARYTAWLKVLRGHVRCVVGTRAAAWAPVRDLGLLACFDDGDDLLAEPRAPYPQTREILRIRAARENAGLVLGGFARSVAVQQWVEQGWMPAVEPVTDRARLPRVLVAGDDIQLERAGAAAHAHLPPIAWSTAHDALAHGPVLVQVPRRGYLPTVRCANCRTIARCTHCHGPLGLRAPNAPPVCGWCARVADPWSCPECGHFRLRAAVVGARRTAEELGRAFPSVPVVRSGVGEIVASVPDRPALVIATPGAEPIAEGGYAATLLLDGWALLDRPALDAGEETLRRWLAAAALTRPSAAKGAVVVCGVSGDVPQPTVEALVRWAPGSFAARELADRAALGLPPATAMVALTGAETDLTEFTDSVRETFPTPSALEVLGPLPAPGDTDSQRVLLRAPLLDAAALAHAVLATRAARSARKARGAVTVRVDPTGALL